MVNSVYSPSFDIILSSPPYAFITSYLKERPSPVPSPFDHGMPVSDSRQPVSYCDNEDMYIKMTEKLTRKMLKFNYAGLDDIFFGNPPEKKEFHEILNKILKNISKLV